MFQGRAVALLLTAGVCLAAAEYSNTVQRTFALTGSGGERRLLVSNINGSVRVSGTSGDQIRVTATEHWTADNQDDLNRGRADVQLVMEQTGNAVSVTLDGPFRNPDRSYWGRRPSYRFHHDFEITVPRDIELTLKTVNGPDLIVSDTTGNWNVSNVNGRVVLERISGSGRAHTVNGPIKAVFTSNPSQSCSFETVNGEIDTSFRPGLNADLRLSTMHGDAYTDFEIQPLSIPVAAEKSGEGSRFRLGGGRRLRIGNGGGTEHSFKTLNGTIKIRKGEGQK